MAKIYIDKVLLDKYPDVPIEHMRKIIAACGGDFVAVSKKARIFNYKMPHVGTFKTHGNKKSNFKIAKTMKAVKKKNSYQAEFTTKYLLF